MNTAHVIFPAKYSVLCGSSRCSPVFTWLRNPWCVKTCIQTTPSAESMHLLTDLHGPWPSQFASLLLSSHPMTLLNAHSYTMNIQTREHRELSTRAQYTHAHAHTRTQMCRRPTTDLHIQTHTQIQEGAPAVAALHQLSRELVDSCAHAGHTYLHAQQVISLLFINIYTLMH
jgi:hypothetical protein